MDHIKLENPVLLHLLWALLLLAVMLYAYHRWRTRTLRTLGSPALEQKLLLGFSPTRFWLKIGLFAAGMALVIAAMVNPYQIKPKAASKQQSSDVIVAMDVSQSMLCTDVSPDRLEVSRRFVQRLVQSLEGERIGLVFFAGSAFPEVPLTSNQEATLMFVRNASPAFITDQGTSIDEAIQVSSRLFDPNSKAGRTLILISDGENFGTSAARRALEARQEGVVIHTVAVGTPGGGKIPLSGNRFKTDQHGNPVVTRPDQAALREIARTGGGMALVLSGNDEQLSEQLKTEVYKQQKAQIQIKAGTDVLSYFQWLVLPAILLLVAEQLLWWRKQKKQDA